VVPSGSTSGGGGALVFLLRSCRAQYSATLFRNVTVNNLNDLTQTIQVMSRDPAVSRQTFTNQTGASSAGLIALSVPVTGYFGGYPENLAQASQDLGYDMVILRGLGGDPMEASLSRVFWRDFVCPIPTYRTSLFSSFVDISSKFSVDILDDPDPARTRSHVENGISFVLESFVGFSMLYLCIFKLRFLLRTDKFLTAASVVCITGVLHSLCHLFMAIYAIVDSTSDVGIDFVSYSAVTGVGAMTAIVSTFAIAFRFHVAMSTLDTVQRTSIFRKSMNVGWFAAVIGVILLLIGTILVCRQQVVNLINWYSVSLVYYSIFRFIIMIYFIWSQWKVIKLLKETANTFGEADKQTQIKNVRFMSIRLSLTGFFTFFSLFCFMYAATPYLYEGHGYYSLTFGLILTGFSVLLEVTAVKSDSVAEGFIDRMMDMLSSFVIGQRAPAQERLLREDDASISLAPSIRSKTRVTKPVPPSEQTKQQTPK
jgi:hypothetical protein